MTLIETLFKKRSPSLSEMLNAECPGEAPVITRVLLPTKEELELARQGKLPIGRAAELGMHVTRGNPITIDEWASGIRYDENGNPASVFLGLNRSAEVGLNNTIFVPRAL